ncbi:MAG TPA: M1 family aminopeptidase, partial [Isosphaeraceae bacterium]|nr:M1 family aminopeptidase [Isosphaeraceae bacterium]
FHARHFNVWLDLKPETGHRILMQTYPGGIMSGMDYYQNDAGIVVCETTLDQTAFNPEGEPVCSRIRRALQHSDSIDGVVAVLSNKNNGLYSNEWLMADMKTDEIAMFELGTDKSRLWRSGQNQWFAGVEGFYWGCNNAKDLQVRLETVPGVEGKPVNVLFHPTDRDRAWLKLYDRWKGRIDADFGFEAFTTAPLCSSRALDAKFTTAKLTGRLESYAVFGPPRGQVWEPTDAERDLYPEIGPLLPHDWTLLSAQAPPAPSAGMVQAVDLGGPSAQDATLSVNARRPPAWHGTILPASDADLWLAAAFADYERIVALEKALGAQKDGRSQGDQALFAPMSKYLSARARTGSDLALGKVKRDVRSDAWYDIASGKGVLVLDSLRKQLGARTFDSAMDHFGRAHAGRTASTDEFFETLEKASGKPLRPSKADWINSDGFEHLDPSVAERFRQGRFWSVTSFEHEPDRVKIVYRTASDSRGNREAAYRLQHLLRTKWSNISAPVMADSDLRESDLSGTHLILIGTPYCSDGALA